MGYRPLRRLPNHMHLILGLAPQALRSHALRAFALFSYSITPHFTLALKTSSIRYGRRQPLDETSCLRLSVQIG